MFAMSKKLFTFFALLMILILASGCAGPTEDAAEEQPASGETSEESAADQPASDETEAEEPAAEAPEELYLVYLTPSTESGYWGEYVRIGIENAVMDAEEEYGVTINYEYAGPALESSQDEYLSILEGVIAKGPDALIMGQLAPDAVAPFITDATDMGTYVNLVSVGVDLPGEQFGSLYYCDQPEQGALAAQAFYDAMVAKGLPMDGVVGVHMSVVVPILEAKIQNFVDTLQELAPDLTLLETQYNENDVNNGISLMEAQLAAYGDELIGFFGGNNVTGDAIVRVIEESGRAEALVGVAVDSDPAEIEGMRNGYLDALVVQTPYDQAYNAVASAVAHILTGEEFDDEVNMPASVVTPDNMDDPDMAALLDPTILARGEAEEPAAEAIEELYLVYLTPSTESGYWGEYVRIGIENAVMDAEEEYGVTINYEYAGPALESSQDEYLSILEGVIAKGPDALIMGQLAPDAVAPFITDATDMGTYVNLVSVGVDLPGEQFGSLYYCDQPEQGALAAQAFYDAMVAKGLPMDGVVGVHMSVVVPILEAKIQNFVDTLQELAPDLTLLETQYNENDVNNGISLMEAQLAAYGDELIGFFGGNNVTGDAIVRVIEESGRAEALVGVAVDSDPAEIEGMRNGYLDALVVQTPYDQAYNAVASAVAHILTGEEFDDEVNMPASVVTPDNMDDPDMAALLDPTILARGE